jgi:hypothetical protein
MHHDRNFDALLIFISNAQAQTNVLQMFRHDYDLSLYKMLYPLLESFISYTSGRKLNTELKWSPCGCFILIKNDIHEVAQSMFHNKAQELTIGGINVAANPEVCSHNVHIMDSCRSVYWTELAQKNPVIGPCEHIFTYCWTFSFVLF